MYNRDDNQISFFDFNQSCGMQLDSQNEWILRSQQIDWDAMEKSYRELFPSKTGRPAKSFRMAFGSLIIQKRKQIADRALVKEIAENPYLQYFIGLPRFQNSCPFTAPALVSFRKRIHEDMIIAANEMLLQDAESTPEHSDEPEVPETKSDENTGTVILDATCSPQNIKYPQDFVLCMDGIEKLQEMIDYFHREYHPFPKPRTYRRVMREEYLALAKAKKRPVKKIRQVLRKELGCLSRDIRYIEEYLSAGCIMPEKYRKYYETIKVLYEQQKYMFDNHTHSIENRIVSISQPYVRPIVRGKAKSPVEFGAKYDLSIDEKGHARLEKISFDPYNESTIFQDALNRYFQRTGHYPERVLVDKIYRTRSNLAFCKEHGIRISGPKLGRPSEDSKTDKKVENQDNTDRIEVERFFSLEKRCNGAGLIVTKLEETSIASIALSVFVTNLFAIPCGNLFLYYISDDERLAQGAYFMFFDAEDA